MEDYKEVYKSLGDLEKWKDSLIEDIRCILKDKPKKRYDFLNPILVGTKLGSGFGSHIIVAVYINTFNELVVGCDSDDAEILIQYLILDSIVMIRRLMKHQ